MTTRRSILAMAVAGATALGLLSGTAPAAWAQAKDIVYLTPGLDLPFWRYLSKGVESAAKEKGYGFQASTWPTAPRPSCRTPRIRSPAASRGSSVADRLLDRAERAASSPRRPGSRS